MGVTEHDQILFHLCVSHCRAYSIRHRLQHLPVVGRVCSLPSLQCFTKASILYSSFPQGYTSSHLLLKKKKKRQKTHTQHHFHHFPSTKASLLLFWLFFTTATQISHSTRPAFLANCVSPVHKVLGRSLKEPVAIPQQDGSHRLLSYRDQIEEAAAHSGITLSCLYSALPKLSRLHCLLSPSAVPSQPGQLLQHLMSVLFPHR